MTLLQELERKDDGTVNCLYCERSSTTLQGLQLHCIGQHDRYIPNNRCLECEKEFFIKSGNNRKYCDTCNEEDREGFPYPTGHDRRDYALRVQEKLIEYAKNRIEDPVSGNHLNKNRFKKKFKEELTSEDRSEYTFYHVVGKLVKSQDFLVESSRNSFRIDTEKLNKQEVKETTDGRQRAD